MHVCSTCAAHQQTIVMLADQVDWLRAQLAAGGIQVTAAPVGLAQPEPKPTSFVVDKSKWLNEDAEDIEAALEAGAIDTATAEAALAAVQAQNTHIELVK